MSSFGFLFAASTCMYLWIIPFAIDGYDTVTGASALAGEDFYLAFLLYVLFYLLGVRIMTPFSIIIVQNSQVNLKRTGPSLVYRYAFLFISSVFTLYSLWSGNIFGSGGLLFTILGFDFLLVYYLATRNERSSVKNFIFFTGLLLLFLFAGFRYRIAILILAEALTFYSIRASALRSIVSVTVTFLMIFLLSAFGQFRTYGEFNLSGFFEVEFQPIKYLTQSGEQTVSISTISVIEHLETIELVGVQPFVVTFTHFIPSAIWPDKPRVTYLDAYFDVTDGLSNTGTAMHDLAQAGLMFGIAGMPLAAFLLGLLCGTLLRWGLQNSPTPQFAVACIVLFAVFIPTRGYLPQQVTWALSFALPVILWQLSNRIVWKRKRRTI